MLRSDACTLSHKQIYHHVSGTSLAHAKAKNENLNVYSGRLNFRFSVSLNYTKEHDLKRLFPTLCWY